MTSGPILFARYAYPPNELGYCGSDAAEALIDHLDAGVTDADLRKLVSAFEGAWPYLTLIAEQAQYDDPLDLAVVHAYWIGNRLLDEVRLLDFGNSLHDRFRDRASGRWGVMAEAITDRAVPHHSFHVFCVYPWVGLLRAGTVDPAMRVLDRCRIRAGTVLELSDDHAVVDSSPLGFVSGRIVDQPSVPETVRLARDGKALTSTPHVGDIVTLHWDWVCDVVTDQEANHLAAINNRHIAIANRSLRGSLLDA